MVVPPSAFWLNRIIVPASAATTRVPIGARMSLARCVRPPDLGSLKLSDTPRGATPSTGTISGLVSKYSMSVASIGTADVPPGFSSGVDLGIDAEIGGSGRMLAEHAVDNTTAITNMPLDAGRTSISLTFRYLSPLW